MTTKIHVLLVFVLTLLLHNVQAQDSVLTLQDAKNAFLAEDWDKAKSIYERCYKTEPSDTACILGLVETYLRLQDATKAEGLIAKALKTYPELPQLQLKYGLALNMKSKFKKSLEAFKTADQFFQPTDPLRQTLFVNYGIAYLGLEKFPEAIECFDKVLAINPRNATAYNYKGMTLYRMSDYDEALRMLNLSLDIDLQNPITLYNRGVTYLKLEDRRNACLDFHAACRKGNMNACKQILIECKQQQ